MKQQLVEALAAHFSGHIIKHDWMTAVEAEIAQIAEYEDKLEVLSKHFEK